MARKNQKNSLRLAPVEPDEMMFAFGVFHAAADMRMVVENPSLKALNILDDDGTVTRLRFTDKPINRAGLAVAKHFKDAKFRNIMPRIIALHRIYKHKKLAAWVRKKNETLEVAESLLAAAARAPLSWVPRLAFDVDILVELATEYDEQHDLVDELPS